MENKIVKKIILISYLLLFAALLFSCHSEAPSASGGETGTAAEIDIDNLPRMSELPNLSYEEKTDMCKLIFSLSADEMTEHLKTAYEQAISTQSEFTFHSVSAYQDKTFVKNGVKPLNNFFVELVLHAEFDIHQSEAEVNAMASSWLNETLDKVIVENPLSVFGVQETKIRFVDPPSNRTVAINSQRTPIDGNTLYGVTTDQPEDEARAQKIVCDFLEEQTENTEEYNEFMLTRFGVLNIGINTEKELYIEIILHWIEEDMDLYHIAQALSNKLQSSTKAAQYMEREDFSVITIVFNGDKDLTYNFYLTE